MAIAQSLSHLLTRSVTRSVTQSLKHLFVTVYIMYATDRLTTRYSYRQTVTSCACVQVRILYEWWSDQTIPSFEASGTKEACGKRPFQGGYCVAGIGLSWAGHRLQRLPRFQMGSFYILQLLEIKTCTNYNYQAQLGYCDRSYQLLAISYQLLGITRDTHAFHTYMYHVFM